MNLGLPSLLPSISMYGAASMIPFLVGLSVGLLNIAIHALTTVIVIRTARSLGLISTSRPYLHLVTVTITTASVLMAAHTIEVLVWSLAYALVSAAPDGTNLVDFAFVNYTTLGYGDVVPLNRWRLLGPMTAMNGVLMFGWSTALIFAVLQKTVERHNAFASSSR
jgi:Ion channel